MFPILKGTNRIVTNGYYFPFALNFYNRGMPLFIAGYRPHAPIITLGQSDNLIFQSDIGVEIHFPVPDFNLLNTSNVSIRFKMPTGTTYDVEGALISNSLVAYTSQPGDFSTLGTWNYQISVRFGPTKLYHLNSGKFRVRPII
jgi:hypothetical protein